MMQTDKALSLDASVLSKVYSLAKLNGQAIVDIVELQKNLNLSNFNADQLCEQIIANRVGYLVDSQSSRIAIRDEMIVRKLRELRFQESYCIFELIESKGKDGYTSKELSKAFYEKWKPRMKGSFSLSLSNRALRELESSGLISSLAVGKHIKRYVLFEHADVLRDDLLSNSMQCSHDAELMLRAKTAAYNFCLKHVCVRFSQIHENLVSLNDTKELSKWMLSRILLALEASMMIRKIDNGFDEDFVYIRYYRDNFSELSVIPCLSCKLQSCCSVDHLSNPRFIYMPVTIMQESVKSINRLKSWEVSKISVLKCPYYSLLH